MKSLLKSLRVLAVPLAVAALCAGVPATAYSPDRVGKYDFTYSIAGDARVRPVQVFDDGHFTVIQFRPGEPVPAVFATTGAGPELISPVAEGPYFKYEVLSGEYTLKLGQSQGKITYMGVGRQAPGQPLVQAPVAASYEASASTRLVASSRPVPGEFPEAPRTERIATEISSYATPIKGDRVNWTDQPVTDRLPSSEEAEVSFVAGTAKFAKGAEKALSILASRVKGSYRIELVGVDDDSMKEGLAKARTDALRAAFARLGVPQSQMVDRPSSLVAAAKRAAGESQVRSLVRWSALRQVDLVVQPKTPEDKLVADLKSGAISPGQAIQQLDVMRRRAAAEASMPAAPAPSTALWEMRKDDKTLEGLLGRWAKDAGWRLVWREAPVVDVSGDAPVLKGAFIQAVDKVVVAVNRLGYGVDVEAYSNKVLVVTKKASVSK